MGLLLCPFAFPETPDCQWWVCNALVCWGKLLTVGVLDPNVGDYVHIANGN